MDLLEDNDLTLNQQIFNLQLDLENKIKIIDQNSINDNSIEIQRLIYDYLDDILKNKLVTINDFGNEVEWLNVENNVLLRKHLNGLLVVIDFFTYCCINCLHILPKLRQFELKFQSKPVVVIGVHSPKFDNEKDIKNVCDSVLKYNIDHPIANDSTAKVWSQLEVQCWPTLVILGPGSQLLFTLIGENGVHRWLDLYTETAIKYFESKSLIIEENKSKIALKLVRNTFNIQLLGFPSKVSASEDQTLIAISNSRYNNIIISTNNGVIKHIIGAKESGFKDGSFSTARFNDPNGVVWADNHIVYVADTQNHAIRRIDIKSETVITLVGNGEQSDDKIGGKIGCEQGLNSPWDVCCDHNNRLFIAMAGSHQIWVLALENDIQLLNKIYPKGCCFTFAGDGKEQNRNNKYPLKASFAQPSGLAIDEKNNRLFVADSESSSVRTVDINTGCVSAIVGGDRDPQNLFAFGDIDGKGVDCRLQHCLGISFDAINNCLFVADSYNHKIKKIELSTKYCKTIAGTGQRGHTTECKFSDCFFNEPNGLCLINGSKDILLTDTNNHCLKLLDLDNNFVKEFKLFEIKSQLKTDSNQRINDKKVDFVVELNPIKFSPKNTLKLEINLNIGSKIKLTEGAKHLIIFENPDQTLFSISHKSIEDLELLSQFSLVFNHKTSEVLNKTYYLLINTTFNLCNIELNFCKQIKTKFVLPIILCDTQSEQILIEKLVLPFNDLNL